MTHNYFLGLLPRAQLLVAISQGTHLARRWNRDGRVNLYYLAGEERGFFTELGYKPSINEIVVLRSFTSTALLERYLYYMPLPALPERPTS